MHDAHALPFLAWLSLVYGPVAVTFLSSMRLPNDEERESETRARLIDIARGCTGTKDEVVGVGGGRRSTVHSCGRALVDLRPRSISMPEYSWMYMSARM